MATLVVLLLGIALAFGYAADSPVSVKPTRSVVRDPESETAVPPPPSSAPAPIPPSLNPDTLLD
ncbi:MAG: hypothetical protein ABI718_09470 [Acidobacteriota bacterium]